MLAAVEAEALDVMATIESNLTWNAVDYNSNIKVGIVQWTGGNAARLLDTLESTDKQQLATTLLSDLATYAYSDPFWSSRFLSKDEGNSIIEALGTATAETTQRSFFSTMIDSYDSVMSTWGCNSAGTVDQQKAFIFYACIYHVNIVVAANICSAIGGTATVNDIYDAVMNKPQVSTIREWYKVRDMLIQWQGVEPTVTGDTTQPWTEPGGGGQQNATITQVESQIQRIGQTGQTLIIYGKDNANGVVCYRSTNNFWIPTSNTAAPPTPTPVTPPAPVDPATQSEWEQMRQLWYDNEGAWRYSQGPGRLDPPSSGYSDCSASIIWAVSKIRPDLGRALGEWTGSMVNAGREIARGSTGAGAHIDTSLLQPGDILLVGNNYTFDNAKSHVEWYFGEGQLWGSGYGPLPHRSGDVNAYLVSIANYGKSTYMFRRFLD